MDDEVKGCVKVSWWRQPAFNERYARLIAAIQAEGYKTSPHDMNGFLDENSSLYHTIIDVKRPRKLFELTIWPYEWHGHKTIPYTLDLEGGSFEEAQKLANILCVKLNEKFSIE